MGTKQTERRKAAVRKETVRKLDQATLSPADLRQAAGGGHKLTCPCPTNPG